MPPILEKAESLATPAVQLSARNQELLHFRDPALNLAYRICGNAADAEDILQDAFLRAVKAPSPILCGNELRNWFFQITANAGRDWLRSERSRRSRERDAAMDQTLRAAPADSESGDLKARVEKELAQLDEKYRLPIALHYEQGLSYEEAAGVLGLTSGTLRVYASQGIKELREKLDAPGRPVTAEIVVGLIGAGLLLKASPALAASVEAIVATSAKTAVVSTAAITAKSASAAGKPFVVLANSAAPKSLIVALGLGLGACAAALAIVFGYRFFNANTRLAETPPSAPPPAHTDAVVVAPADVAPALPAVELMDSREIQTKYIKPNSPMWPAMEKAIGEVKSPGGSFLYEWRVDAVFLRLKDTPTALQKMQSIVLQFDVPPTAVTSQRLGNLFPVPPVDYVPDEKTEALWAASDNLIPLTDPARYTVGGKWTMNGGNLIGAAGSFARIAFPYIPPEEYDLRVDFTRSNGSTDINMVFPAQGLDRIFKIESWGTGYFGYYKGNPDVVPLKISNNVRHTSIIEVRRSTLAAYLDGRLIKSIEMDKSASRCEVDWHMGDRRMIGVGAWRSDLAVHRVAVRNVTGTGAAMPADIDAANAVSEDYWKDALDLMPKTISPKNAPVGKWKVENDHLASDATRFSRYQIDYAPPEEYDYRVMFYRVDGKSDILQILSVNGHQFAWKMDIAGISLFDVIDGTDRDHNPTTLLTPSLVTNGKLHTSVVCVRKSGLKAYFDGRLINTFPTDYSNLSIEGAWKLPTPAAIGVGFHVSSGVFEKIQIKEVTGKGKVLEPQKEKGVENGAF